MVQLWRDSGRDMVREGFRFAQPRRGWRVMGWRGRAQRPWCRSPCVLRAVFFVLVRNNPSLRIASASQRIPVGPARRSPRTPSDKRHTNAYGCHESPFEPSINSFIHRQEAEERPSVGWVRRRNRQTPPASLPVFCQVVIGQCGMSFPSEKAVGFSPVRNWPVIARVLLFHCIRA